MPNSTVLLFNQKSGKKFFDREKQLFSGKTGVWLAILTLSLVVSLSQLAQAQVSGTVFRDIDGDGLQSTTYLNEPGIAGLTVRATKPNGSTVIVTTGTSGTFAFSSVQIPSATKVRLEFLGASTEFDSPLSASSGTSVQFITAPSTTANLGLIATTGPDKFFNPCVVTSCFTTLNTTTDPALITFRATEVQDNAQPFVNQSTSQFTRKAVMTETVLATQGQIGTVNGITYHNASNTILAAAFVRNSGQMPHGSGAIYKIVNPNSASPTVSLLTTISGTGSLSVAASVGTEALTGFAGLGDLALSAAQDILYTVNLNTKQLVAIPLSGTALTAGTPTTTALPVPTVAGTTAADFHPLGLGVKNGKLYVAITCGKLGSQAGYIYEYNGTAFTLKLTIPFDYTRAYRNANYYGYPGYPQYLDNNQGYLDWNAVLAANYLTDASGNYNNGTAANPKFQPWIADIDFDGNDMIIGVRSRLADARNTSFWVPGGDILRACSTDGVTWTLENNGTCGTKTTGPIPATDPYTGRAYTGTFNTFSLNTNFGPGGSEYYWGDDGFEGEASQGSLLMLPGYSDVLVSQVDAIGHTGQVGVMALSNTKGSITAAGNIFFGDNGTGNNIGKSNGLGGLSYFPNPATIEIGNRVWKDDNRNGIQDAAEAGIANVTIGLYHNNTLVTTAITDASGNYYFSSAAGTNSNSAKYGLTIISGDTYELRILTTQAAVSAFTPTSVSAGGNNTVDSDFSVSGTNVLVSFVAGAAGQNNHTFDAGFVSCPTITFTAPASATTTVCANTTLAMSVSTNAIAPDQIRFVYFDSPLVSPTDAYTATGGAVLGTVTSGTLTTNTVTLANAQLPDNQGNTSRTIYIYAILVSADGLCQPVAQRAIVLNPRPIPAISGDTQICQGSTATLTASGPVGMTYQWFLNNGTTPVSAANPYTTPVVSTTTTYRLRGTFNSCVSNDVQIVLTPVPCTPCVSSPTAIGGVVYRDFNGDGINNTEPGMGAVTVTIFRCDVNGSSTQVAQMQTDIKGQYSFTGLTGSTVYRVEFSNLPAGYQPTYDGTNNGTTAQFLLPGTCNASLGLNQPVEYCQNNPRMVTPCYIDGAVAPNTGGGDVLIGFDYNVIGSSPTNKTTDGIRTDIGSTWGLAYDKATKQMFVSAFLKRHVGLKDSKLGQIYVKDYNNPSAAPVPWLDVSTLPGIVGTWTYLSDATRGLGNAGSPSLDADAFAKIAEVGLGDIDISDDNKTLYAMDLLNRQLLAIDVATKALIGKYPIPDVCSGTAGPAYYTASSKSFTAIDGKTWRKGVVFDTDNQALEYAQTINNPNSVTAGTTDATLYATSVYTASSMGYEFPMGNGTYSVKMHFATNLSITNRNTNVLAENTPVISGLDVYAASGNQVNYGLTRSFTTTVTDGVLSISVINGAGSTYAAISGFEITPTSGQAKGVTRPFATKYRNGKVYVGAVCDASFSQNRDDLQASVFTFDPTAGSFNTTPVLTFPLTYLRGASYGAAQTGSNNRWEPWTSVYPNNTGYGILYGGFDVYTQPVFSDIEFDIDGSMLLGFFDRFPNQIGAAPNYRPDRPTTAGLTSNYGVVGGDILRAYFNGSSFELESNGKEGASSSKAPTAGANNLQGPGGGEFYFGDAIPDVHNETSMGGLALLPGSGEVRLTSGDPLVLGSGGVLALNNTTGAKLTSNSFTLYAGGGGGVQYKANGLGDLELLCNLAPIQIGNRVWRDDNRNGIQDPCEPPIVGAVVKLYDAAKTTVLASVTTNAAGEYYFSSTTLTTGNSTSSVATTALTYNTNYALQITSLGSGTAASGLALTDVTPVTPGESGTANSGLTPINNDAMVMNGKPTIMLSTGGPGSVNHTYDFGLAPCAPPSVTLTASSNAVCVGQAITLTSLVSTGGSLTVTGPVGVSLTGATTGTAIATNLITGVNIFTVTASNSPTCFTTATVSVTVSATPLITLTASQSAICLGQSVTLNVLGIPAGGIVSYGTQGPLGTLLNPTASPIFSPTATTTFLASVSVPGIGGLLGSILNSCPLTVTVNQPPVIPPLGLSVCAGATLDLTSLSGLSGLTNVFRTGNVLGLGTILNAPTSVSVGVGVNLFNVTSTSPTGCTAATPISVTGIAGPSLTPISLSLCAGATLDLTSLSGLSGLTNVFRTGNVLGLGTILNTPTSVSVGVGVNLFNVTSTSPTGCTAATPISVTGIAGPSLTPISLSLCAGATLDLTSLSGLSGLTNVFRTGNVLGLGTILNTPTSVSVGVGVNLFNVTSTSPTGCTAATPISVTGIAGPSLTPISLSLCAGATLDLTSLSGLSGLTNVFRTGNVLGLGTILNTPTSVSVGVGVNLFNVTSTSPTGCTAATPISVTGIAGPSLTPISLSLCAGATLDLTSLSGLSGLTNVFRTGNVLGLGTILNTPTSVSVGVGVNLFNVTSTSPTGCTAATPISVTGIAGPSLTPISLSLCAGATLDLTSLSGLSGLTNVFRTGNVLGLGTILNTPTSVSVGVGVNLFNVTSTSPTGCTAATPISVTGVAGPSLTPISLSLCAGATLDLTSLSGLSGLTNVFRTGNVLGLGTILNAPTSVSVGVGVNLFNVTSTSPTGCTAATPISVTGIAGPGLSPISLSLCAGATLDLTSLSGLSGLTNVFRTGNVLGLGTILNTPTSVSVGVGVNLFNVTSTSPTGCTAATPISVTGIAGPGLSPISLSLCAGATLDLTSLSGLSGLTNVFRTGNVLGLGTILNTPTSVSVGVGVNLFNVTSTSPTGCTAATPISVTGVAGPSLTPISLSLCAGATLDLTSLSGLSGLTNVFRTGNVLGLGTILNTPTSVSVGVGVNLFNVTSTSPTGCTAATPISVTGIAGPGLSPISLSLCAGATLDLTSLSGLSGLTNVFRTGNVLGLGTILNTPTSVSVGVGVNLFNVTSTSPTGCTAATPISVTGISTVVTLNSATVCTGQPVSLTATGAGVGATYVFSVTGSVGNILTIIPTVTAAYTVTATISGGCTATATAQVTVNAKPSAGDDQTLVCGPVGQTPTSTTLTVVSIDAGLWSQISGSTASIATPLSRTTAITSLTTGNYVFVFTTINGCTDTVQVVVPSCAPPLGSIGDFVWNDQNKNGKQDSNEPGVNGITVRLLQETTPGNYTVVSTTVTSGNGGYLFPNLSAGTYVVEFDKTTLPPNYVFTTPTASGVPTSLDSDADTSTGRSAPVTLVPTNPAQRDILTVDAGVYDSSCAPPKCVPIVIQRTR